MAVTAALLQYHTVLYRTGLPISQKQATGCVHRTVHSFIYVYFNTGLQTIYTSIYFMQNINRLRNIHIHILHTQDTITLKSAGPNPNILSQNQSTILVNCFILFYNTLYLHNYCTVHHIPLYFLTIGWILHVIQYIYISHQIRDTSLQFTVQYLYKITQYIRYTILQQCHNCYSVHHKVYTLNQVTVQY